MATEFEKYDPVKHGELSRPRGRALNPKWARLAVAARAGDVFVPVDGYPDLKATDGTLRAMLKRVAAADERVSIRTLENKSGVVVRVLPR